MAKYEHELAALDGLGLTDLEMDDALTHLLSFVQANARDVVDARAARRESARNDEQWWASNADLLARALDERAYPLASRVGTAAGSARGSAHDPDHAYHFGLQRLLDGLTTLIEAPSRIRRRAAGSARQCRTRVRPQSRRRYIAVSRPQGRVPVVRPKTTRL